MPTTSSDTELAAAFQRDGYLRLERLASPDELARIRALLDPLFESAANTSDLASDGHGGRPRIPEVNRPSRLVPALRATATFRRCRSIARAILNAPVGYVFDHAIYKPPQNQAATSWHQDLAYAGRPVPLRSIHFWIPLQPATLENGCMWYVPGSHTRGLVPHASVPRATGGTLLVADPSSDDRAGAVPCLLPAGGCAVHGPLTLHYSGANEAQETRRAWIVHFAAYGRLVDLHPRNVLAKLRERMDVRA